jgi:hypothetical protein
VKTTCCKSYQHKGKACKQCPVMVHRDPKAQKPGRKHHKSGGVPPTSWCAAALSLDVVHGCRPAALTQTGMRHSAAPCWRMRWTALAWTHGPDALPIYSPRSCVDRPWAPLACLPATVVFLPALLRPPLSSAGEREPVSGSLHPAVHGKPGVQLGVGIRRCPGIVARLRIDREPDVTPALP